MLSSILFNLFKALFSIFSSKKQVAPTQREKEIFGKTLHVNNKIDMIERIDYWIEKNDFKEAEKLSCMYIEYNGEDKNILERKSKIKILK